MVQLGLSKLIDIVELGALRRGAEGGHRPSQIVGIKFGGRKMRARLACLLFTVSMASARQCKQSDVSRPDGSFALAGCDEVVLFGESIGDEGAQKLAAALGVLGAGAGLQLLDLWRNGIGPAGARAIGAALAKGAKVGRLYLNENPLGADGVRAIAAGIAKSRSPEHLWLSRTGAAPRSGRTAPSALRTSRARRDSCELRARQRGGSPLPPQPATSPRAPLSPLSSRSPAPAATLPGAGDEGAAALATALRTNRELQALDLWECGITGAGAASLATALEENKGLRVPLWVGHAPN